MKSSFLIGMGIFWSVVVVFAITGLVSYENKKLVERLNDRGSSTSPGIQDDAVRAAIESGQTVWSQELVAGHNALEDCWMTIDGVIYDVTEYTPFHPGGTQTILDSCGTDATEAFKTKGSVGSDHSANAYELLGRYKVAALGDPLPVGQGPREREVITATQGGGEADTVNPGAGSVVPPTTPVAPKPTPTALTAATVAAHNTTSDCWLIINSKVYDVTQYIPFHPGGTNTIKPWCGKESTNAFSTMGGKGKNHSSNAWSLLEKYSVGTLGGASAATPVSPAPAPVVPPTTPVAPKPTPTALTAATVAAHNTTSDCWLIINSKVYDVTQYIPFHPGGTNTIKPWCGKESTNAFSTMGGKGKNHSSNAWSLLEKYSVGTLGGTATVSTTPTNTTTPSTTGDPATPYREAILKRYPGATITKISIEDDGRAEIKFVWNGNEYEGKMDASYNIIKIED